MKNLNLLTYEISDWNGLSFEILIDEKPLAEYAGFRNHFRDNLIPYWLVEEGFPVYEQTGELIVAVCGCGEYGCDCVLCNVTRKTDFVTLTDFRRERGFDLRQIEFEFTLENFQDIESKLKFDADEKRQSFEK